MAIIPTFLILKKSFIFIFFNTTEAAEDTTKLWKNQYIFLRTLLNFASLICFVSWKIKELPIEGDENGNPLYCTVLFKMWVALSQAPRTDSEVSNPIRSFRPPKNQFNLY